MGEPRFFVQNLELEKKKPGRPPGIPDERLTQRELDQVSITQP